MSFLLSTGASDMAQAWVSMSASDRTTIKQQYQSAGIKLLVSAFGSTETPTTSGANPQSLAATMAAWVKQYGVDGIDVDYEDTTAMNKGDGKAEQWIIDFTTALRTELPQAVGSQIDWYNTQFYNQGPDEYTTCAGLLTTSSSNNPKSSVFEIQANGFELNKLVIGKPGSTADASNGQMSTNTLAQCVSQAKGMGWNAGVMSWEYPDANSAWISAVRSSAFPLDGSPGSGSSAPVSVTSTANTDPDSTSPTGSVSSTVSGTTGAQPTSASSDDGISSTSPTNTFTTPSSLEGEPTSTGTGTVGAAPTQTPSDGDSSSIVSDTGTGATSSSTPPTSIDSGSGPTPTDTDSGSPTIAPDSTTDEPSVTQTFNNGLWTPTAPTHTFNNGLWTPTANPTGSAIPQRRTSLHEEYPGRRMVRRSRSRTSTEVIVKKSKALYRR
ncbi:glycoside hydrolase superfamily [Rhodocollybia butyracea]|uniref:Glycoside hydrolase superfamily n=1 Tax=Rhodocollybia butyracea TaxID=206335 RepID=A0A9P5PY47_9AGAR|nr:glycoside hydrolase superfamily [Rhodocollybia butyracea]